VVHTAEGATNYRDLGNYFANPSVQASSHVGIDDNRGECGQYVQRSGAAWTAANANPVAIQAELCGFASWTTSTWKNQHGNMLRNAADWIAEEAEHYNIPIKALTPSQAQGSGVGVCQHKDLGSWGGGHVDCGSGFPMDYVLDLAKGTPEETAMERLLKMSTIKLQKGEGAVTPFPFPPGATRIRSYSTGNATIDVHWLGAPMGTMTPRADNCPDWKIPPDVRGARFTRKDNGDNEVYVSAG